MSHAHSHARAQSGFTSQHSSSNTTRSMRVKGQHKWRIENFKFLLNERTVEGSIFTTHGTSWQLIVYPTWTEDEHKARIAMHHSATANANASANATSASTVGASSATGPPPPVVPTMLPMNGAAGGLGGGVGVGAAAVPPPPPPPPQQVQMHGVGGVGGGAPIGGGGGALPQVSAYQASMLNQMMVPQCLHLQASLYPMGPSAYVNRLNADHVFRTHQMTLAVMLQNAAGIGAVGGNGNGIIGGAGAGVGAGPIGAVGAPAGPLAAAAAAASSKSSTKYFSIFIRCVAPRPVGPKCVEVTFTLVNQKSRARSYQRSSSSSWNFDRDNPSRGYHRFRKIDFVLDPDNGFLTDDGALDVEVNFEYAIRQDQLTHTLTPLDECDRDPTRDRGGADNTALVRGMRTLLMSQEHGDLEITNEEEESGGDIRDESLDEDECSMNDERDRKRDTIRVRVHRAVLVARSPVFRAMFQHDMREKTHSRLCLPNFSAEVIQAMLYYIYCDATPEAHIALPLMRFAHQYQIKDLLDVCQCVVANNLSIPDWCHVARSYCVLSGYEALHTPSAAAVCGGGSEESDDGNVRMTDDVVADPDASEEATSDLHSLQERSASPLPPLLPEAAPAASVRARTERSRARSRSMPGWHNHHDGCSHMTSGSRSPSGGDQGDGLGQGHPTPDCRDFENRCAALSDPSFVSLNRLLYSLREFFRCNMDDIMGESRCVGAAAGRGSGGLVGRDDRCIGGADSEIDWVQFLSSFPRFATSCLRVALASSLRARNKSPWKKNARSLYSDSTQPHAHSHSLRCWDESQRCFPSKHRHDFRSGTNRSDQYRSSHSFPVPSSDRNTSFPQPNGDAPQSMSSSTANHVASSTRDRNEPTRNRKLHHYLNRKSLSRANGVGTSPPASSSSNHPQRRLHLRQSSSTSRQVLSSTFPRSSSSSSAVAAAATALVAIDCSGGNTASSSSSSSRGNSSHSLPMSLPKSSPLSHARSAGSSSTSPSACRKVSDSDDAETSSSAFSHAAAASASSSSSHVNIRDSVATRDNMDMMSVSTEEKIDGDAPFASEVGQCALSSDTDEANVVASAMVDDDTQSPHQMSSSSSRSSVPVVPSSASSQNASSSSLSSSRSDLKGRFPSTSGAPGASAPNALQRSNSLTSRSEPEPTRDTGSDADSGIANAAGVLASRQRSVSASHGAMCGKKRKR